VTIIKGHFDGQRVILDEPVPGELATNTPVSVSVIFQDSEPILSQLAKLAEKGGLPPDFSQQHDHYVKGTPRR